ncbi:hypothetical protein ACFX2I_029383 [Malus domestica]
MSTRTLSGDDGRLGSPKTPNWVCGIFSDGDGVVAIFGDGLMQFWMSDVNRWNTRSANVPVIWKRAGMESLDHVVSCMHGEMDQNKRDVIIREFQSGSSRQVSLVINYDLPNQPENYLHRIGRSGRFGRKGVAINFVTRDSEGRPGNKSTKDFTPIQ